MMIKKISDWTFQWKISFNPDVSKQLQEVIFSQKIKVIKTDYPWFPTILMCLKLTLKNH